MRRASSSACVTTINVTDPQRFDDYRKLAGPAVAQHGGKFLVRGGARTILEGKFDANRLVVVEFPSAEATKTMLFPSGEQTANPVPLAVRASLGPPHCAWVMYPEK